MAYNHPEPNSYTCGIIYAKHALLFYCTQNLGTVTLDLNYHPWLTHKTCTRNLDRFLASDFDGSSCKILYKLAQNRAAFYLQQESMSHVQISCV